MRIVREFTSPTDAMKQNNLQLQRSRNPLDKDGYDVAVLPVFNNMGQQLSSFLDPDLRIQGFPGLILRHVNLAEDSRVKRRQ